jgi:CubicO group peptidase (beta-lactamase class C family)
MRFLPGGCQAVRIVRTIAARRPILLKRSPVVVLVCLGFLLPFHPLSVAQTSDSDAVDDYIHAQMQKRKIPGLALVVVRDSKIERAQGYGFSNVELQVPVRPETIFQSGSMGKQFTAMAVMLLMEQGKLSLDDPLTKFFPDAPSSWKAVKVKNLLSHTGGFTDYPKNFDMRRDYSEDQLLKIVEGIPLAFSPGSKWSYSNLGYLTLGILIHRVSGQFYGDLLHDRVFVPLGMNSTRIISEEDIVPNRAAGYRLVKGELKNQEWVSPRVNTTADGSLYFSILDLAKWDEALREGKFVSSASYKLMWTPFVLNDGKPNSDGYGFGWFIGNTNGHRVIEHAGAWQGFNTNISRYVDDGLTVVMLTNLDGANPEDITHHVAGLLIPALMPVEKGTK